MREGSEFHVYWPIQKVVEQKFTITARVITEALALRLCLKKKIYEMFGQFAYGYDFGIKKFRCVITGSH